MKMMPPATFAPAYALHVALVVFAICSSSDAVVVTSVRSGSSSAVKKTSLLRAASTASMRALQAAVTVKDGDVSRFGPRGCISTWRNEDGHCQIATKCQARDLKDYPIKLLCKDGDGQMVRHVFPGGSFDPEEQFDTLIRCEQCMADTQNVAISDEAKSEDDSDDEEAQSDREQIGSVTEVSKNSRGERGSEATSESSSKSDGESLDRGPLNDLRDQVTELEGFMKKTAAQVKMISEKVDSDGLEENDEQPPSKFYSEDEQGSGEQASDAQAAVQLPLPPSLPPPLPQKSLAHKDSTHHRRQPQLSPPSDVFALPTKGAQHQVKDIDDVYDDASEEDADKRVRATISKAKELEGFMKKVDASEDDDSDDAPDEGELKDPEMIPAEIEGALLQRGGRQTDDIRSEMPRKRDGAFLQRGGHEDDDDLDLQDDQDAEGALNTGEEGEDTEKSEDDDEVENNEEAPDAEEKHEDHFDSTLDVQKDDDEEPFEDAREFLDIGDVDLY